MDWFTSPIKQIYTADPKLTRLVLIMVSCCTDEASDIYYVSTSKMVNIHIANLLVLSIVGPIVLNIMLGAVIAYQENKQEEEQRNFVEEINILVLSIIQGFFIGILLWTKFFDLLLHFDYFFNPRNKQFYTCIIGWLFHLQLVIQDFPQLYLQIYNNFQTSGWNLTAYVSTISNVAVAIIRIFQYISDDYHYSQQPYVNKLADETCLKYIPKKSWKKNGKVLTIIVFFLGFINFCLDVVYMVYKSEHLESKILKFIYLEFIFASYILYFILGTILVCLTNYFAMQIRGNRLLFCASLIPKILGLSLTVPFLILFVKTKFYSILEYYGTNIRFFKEQKHHQSANYLIELMRIIELLMDNGAQLLLKISIAVITLQWDPLSLASISITAILILYRLGETVQDTFCDETNVDADFEIQFQSA